MPGMKRERVKVIIDENGDPSIDILDAVGPSCQKDADEWAALAGGGKLNTMKKPEFFKQSNQKTQKQHQRRG